MVEARAPAVAGPPDSGLPDDYPKAPVVGVGAVVWKDGHVLLIRRGKPPGRGNWSLPGGHQEVGETVIEAAHREVMEETNVSIRILDIAAVVDLIQREGERVRRHFTVVDMVADWIDGEAMAGSDAMDVAWARPQDLPSYNLTEKALEVIAIAGRRRAAILAGEESRPESRIGR